MEKLIITPKTKIHDLLEAYPDLEDVLVSMSPEFKKLKNPVLRKTIARVASVGHAATIGGLSVEMLVNTLREKAGQNTMEDFDESGNNYVTVRPDWFKQEAIVNSIDIRDMLNRGEQPVHEVLSAIANLKANEILEVIAPFIPAPLLDKSLSLGCHHWVNENPKGEFRVYFQK